MKSLIDPTKATPGSWIPIPHKMTMHDGAKLPTTAIVTTVGGREIFVGRVHPKDGTPDDRPIVQMDGRLFAASKRMAELLLLALEYEADQFDGPEHLDLEVSGADLVDWFTEWRLEVRKALAAR